MKPMSKSALAEQEHVVGRIRGAVGFAAYLRVGPHEKYSYRGLESYDSALSVADSLTDQFKDRLRGRDALVYAITASGGDELVTPELAKLAGLA